MYCTLRFKYVNRLFANGNFGRAFGRFFELRAKLITEGKVLMVGRNLSHFLRSLGISRLLSLQKSAFEVFQSNKLMFV